MEILLLLIFAHFIGDFPFQTTWIYKQKQSSVWGGLYHTVGLFLALILCLLPYLQNIQIWLVMGLILGTHFIQDTGKVVIIKSNRINEIWGYFLDQSSHLFFTFLYWYIFLKEISVNIWFSWEFYHNIAWIMYGIGFILVTYFLSVTKFVIHTAQSHKKQNIQRNYKEMLLWGGLYTLIYWSFLYGMNFIF